jgi:predicted FMN-binding regulatory protein PaiB
VTADEETAHGNRTTGKTVSSSLFGHVAKANPHWRYLRERGNATVSFLGPHAYMSPKVYPDLKRVPTWNYLAVECRVKATLIEGNEAADGMLVKLIQKTTIPTICGSGAPWMSITCAPCCPASSASNSKSRKCTAS